MNCIFETLEVIGCRKGNFEGKDYYKLIVISGNGSVAPISCNEKCFEVVAAKLEGQSVVKLSDVKCQISYFDNKFRVRVV